MGHDVPRLIRFDGADNDYIYFSTPSWTTKGVEYELTINKRDGEVLCQCLGSRCHKKSANLVDLLEGKPTDTCKHCKVLVVAYQKLIAETLNL